MIDIGKLTVAKAKAHMQELAETHERVRVRVEQARQRIHEFAPQTLDYQNVELGLTLDEIDAEFYSVCKKSSDVHALAHRFNVDPAIVATWAAQAKDTSPVNCVVRMTVSRDADITSYAMPFGTGRQAKAEELLSRFRETLERHGWKVESFGPATESAKVDVILAEV